MLSKYNRFGKSDKQTGFSIVWQGKDSIVCQQETVYPPPPRETTTTKRIQKGGWGYTTYFRSYTSQV